MHLTKRVILGVLFALSIGSPSVAKDSSWWWPFGGNEEATSATSPPQSTGVTDESWVSWPEMKWPDMPSFDRASAEPTARSRAEVPNRRSAARSKRNSWAKSRAAARPESSSTWQSFSGGIERVGQGTKSAWSKTVDAVTPGDQSTPRVARHDTGGSWWSRMWGDDPQPAEGPRTVTEWMAQERLNP